MNTNEIYKKAKELRYEDFVTWFDGEFGIQETENCTKEHVILEETGYSYSGISDIVRNEPERKNELLLLLIVNTVDLEILRKMQEKQLIVQKVV